MLYNAGISFIIYRVLQIYIPAELISDSNKTQLNRLIKVETNLSRKSDLLEQVWAPLN